MKILYITATYKPSVNGVSVSVENTSKELKNRGHDVYILAPKKSEYTKKEKHVFRYPSLPNPLQPDYPIPLFPLTRQIIKLLFKTKFDIVHAHHPFIVSFFADVVSSLNDIPMIFTYHTRYDQHFKLNLKFIPDDVSEKYAYYTTRRVCRRADLIIAPSKFIQKYIKKNYKNVRIEVLPTGVENVHKNDSKLKLKKRYKLPSNKKILISVIRLSSEKNVHLLLGALKNLPEEYHLVLVGDGPIKGNLKNLALHLEIEKRISFMGKVKHNEVFNFYKLADIHVFPSFSETQGIVFLEAFSFGLPTVAVKSEVNKEWVLEGLGYLSKNNPNDFAKKIIMADALERRRVKTISDKLVKKHSIQNTAQKLEEIYKKAMQMHKLKKTVRKNIKNKIKGIDKFIRDLMQI